MQLKESSADLSLTPEAFDDLMNRTDIGAAKKIAVAVSGGGDSMALTLLLKKWCDQKNKTLVAVTVDHGLRLASKNEAEQVSRWMAAFDIKHHILCWQGTKPLSNIQEEARTARYQLMADWCLEHKVHNLVIGHHQDDQAETFLMRLFRGSGVDGLSAMEINSPLPVSGHAAVTLNRPLLDVPKSDLIAFLESVGQEWFEDPTNDEEKFTRIKIRKLLSESQIEGLDPYRLAATAGRMRRVKSLLDELTESAESDYVKFDKLGFAQLDARFTSDLHEEIALRFLAKCLKSVSGQTYSPRLSKLENLFQKLKNDDFAGQTLNGAFLFKKGNQQIYICREVKAVAADLVVTEPKQYLWDKRFIIDYEGASATVTRISQDRIKDIQRLIPEFKEALANHFGSAAIRDRIVPSLPCIIGAKGEILLMDHLLSILNRTELDGFSAVFKE